MIEIDDDEKNRFSKYDNIEEDIENSTIPFFMVPRIIYISSKEQRFNKYNDNVVFLDPSLNKLFNYL